MQTIEDKLHALNAKVDAMQKDYEEEIAPKPTLFAGDLKHIFKKLQDHGERVEKLEKKFKDTWMNTMPARICDMVVRIEKLENIGKQPSPWAMDNQVCELQNCMKALEERQINDYDELSRPINHQAVYMNILSKRIEKLEEHHTRQIDENREISKRVDDLESGTHQKFEATAKDLEQIFAILEEHRANSQKSAPEPSDSPLKSVFVVMDLESRQPHAHKVFANVEDARVYCCTQVANYSLVEMQVHRNTNNLVP